jgi:hypothetical protein
MERAMGEPTFERRKNPARRRDIPFDVAYQILWNDELSRFDVCRDEESTTIFAADKVGAIRLAVSAAQQESHTLRVAVWSIEQDEATLEWIR